MRADQAVRTSPADRRTVQRALFAPPRDVEPAGLYYTVEQGVAVAERDRIEVDPYARVTTNTYFGRFPASYWQRWTKISDVFVDLEVRGAGKIALMASDSGGEPRTVMCVRATSDTPKRIGMRATLNKFVDGGALWLEVRTDRERLALRDVRWQVAAPARTRGAVAVICTFNRADDCLITMNTLAKDATALAELDALYVIDQGDDPVESRDGFPASQRALGGKLRYARQPNLGGAGGFTRGLYEATATGVENAGAWPYVVLMDDDIMLEPDALVRMVNFADFTETPAIIGAQMLQLLHPNRLHAGAEHVDLPKLRAGRPAAGALHNADMTTTNQEIRVDAEYNAWWSCLIPPQVLVKIGYPLPIFFQWDDIEYGLRAGAAGHPTVTLAGAGVWHADFSWKDWDDWARYFSLRNGLIVSSLHGDFSPTGTARFLFSELLRYLTSMRYGLAATLIAAVEDFLRGPDRLTDGGAQAAAMIRKLRTRYAETAVHPAHGAPVLPTAIPEPPPSKPGLVLLKRAVWHLLGKSRGSVTIAARHSYWWHVSLFDTAVVTDPSQEGVRVRRRDKTQLLSLTLRGTKVLCRLAREGRRAQKLYRAALPELASRENWARLFDADRE